MWNACISQWRNAQVREISVANVAEIDDVIKEARTNSWLGNKLGKEVLKSIKRGELPPEDDMSAVDIT